MIIAASIAAMLTAAASALEWDADPSTPGVQGGSGAWNAGNNWWNGSQNISWVSHGPATFGGVPGTVETARMFASSFTFSSAYTLKATGDNVYLSGQGSPGVITVSADGSGAEITGMLVTNFNGLTKEGSGTLNITGGLKVDAGVTTINEGTLAALVIGPINKLVVAANGTMRLLGNNNVYNIAGTGVIDIGAYSLEVGEVFSAPSPLPPPSGAPSFFGGVITGSGSVLFRESATLSTSSVGSSFMGNVTIASQAVLPTTVTVPTLANSGVNSELGAGSEIKLTKGATLALTGTGLLSSNRRVTLDGTGGAVAINAAAAVATLDGIISGPGSFTKKGAGTLLLAGSNDYAGGTTVDSGTLAAANGASIPDGSKVTVGAAGTFRLLANEAIGALSGSGTVDLGAHTLRMEGGQNDTYNGTITGAGALVKRGANSVHLSGANSNFTGGIDISGPGSLSVPMIGMTGNTGPLGSSGLIRLGDTEESGRLFLTNTGAIVTDRSFSIATGGGLLEVSSASGELGLSGRLEGAGSLTKLGDGRLRLIGDKNLTGAIVIEDGVLDLDGSVATDVAVLNSARLETSGTVPRAIGALTVTGGVLSLGGLGTAATLNTGNVTLDGGSFVFDLEGSASGHDQLKVTGSVLLKGLVALTINLGVDPEDFTDVYRLVLNDGTDITTVFDEASRFVYQGNVLEEGETFLVTSGEISQYFQMHYGLTPEDNDIRIVAAPEPGSALLLATGAVGMLGLRRRRA